MECKVPDINEVKDILETMSDIFSRTGRVCVDSVCQCSSETKDRWAVVPRLQGTFDYIFTLGNANSKFQSLLAVGIQSSSIQGFFQETVSDEMLMDVFGEIANQFCGLLMDSREFTGKFGVLVQSLPQYSITQAYFPKVWGIEGKTWCGNSWISIGYAIRPALLPGSR